MKKLLIVIDMQNDFIDGSLGTSKAQKTVPIVKEKIETYKQNGDDIIFTRDTHGSDYLQTQEGRKLPIEHCIAGTTGHEISPLLDTSGCEIIDKPSFGSLTLAQRVAEKADLYSEIELCGLCTDICVVSNALLLKVQLPEKNITVDASCCAGTTPEGHAAALKTMQACQIDIKQI